MDQTTPFTVLPIKPNPSDKEIKRARNKIAIRYFPQTVYHMKDEEFGGQVYKKYNDLWVIINDVLKNITKYTLSQSNYNSYKKKFNNQLNKYNLSELKSILKENNLETDGNKETLINRIINNVPSKIAEINIWEVNERKKHKPNYKKILRKYENNFLIRILEIKNLSSNGDKISLIQQIVSKIDEDEIPDLIEKVENELTDYRSKLNKLNENQLKIILDNNNLKSDGNKTELITKILENIPLSDMDENIKKASINKDKALKKLYAITGKTDLTTNFKNTLKQHGLEYKHGIEIRNKLVSLINNYKVPPENVESKLNKFILKKSKEIEEEIINELYNITGKSNHNPSYSKQLKDAGLNDNIGNKIKDEIIQEIKSKNIKKDDLTQVISSKIQTEEKRIQDEKLEELYEFTGKDSTKSSFLKLLKDSYLTEKDGLHIKEDIIKDIKTNTIEKNEIIPKIKQIIRFEKIKIMLSNIEETFLNQIFILNNFEKQPNREKQISYILNQISDNFNDVTIETDITKINNIKTELNKLYKKQLEFILKSNNLPITGNKKELINNILSNLHIDIIKLYMNEFDTVNSKLNELTQNELSYILKINKLNISGTKSKIVNEINKNLYTNEINNGLTSINDLTTTLSNLNKNELDYIAEINNITIISNKTELAENIKSNVAITAIADSFNKIEEIKQLVYNFNDSQRIHFLIVNNLPLTSDMKTQCNEILENASLNEISNLNDQINRIKDRLDSFNRNQLHYILVNNNQNIALDKQEQINIILNNLLINNIEKDIKTLDDLEIELNNLEDYKIEEILEMNSIKKSMTKKDNIKKILESIPIKTIIKIIHDGEPTDPDSIDKETIFISPIQNKNGKKTITIVKNKGSKLLILFENDKIYENYISTTSFKDLNLLKLKKPYEYYKNIVIKNKLDGILFNMDGNTFTVKSEQIY